MFRPQGRGRWSGLRGVTYKILWQILKKHEKVLRSDDCLSNTKNQSEGGLYERSAERQGYRSDHYQRSLHTRAGDVKLKIPKLGKNTFESAIMERYKQREISVEEAMAIHAKGKPGRGGKESKEQIAGKLSNMKLGKAAELVRSGSEETFSHHGFPALSIGNESGPITAWSKS